jgi:tungstate transport system permease protein
MPTVSLETVWPPVWKGEFSFEAQSNEKNLPYGEVFYVQATRQNLRSAQRLGEIYRGFLHAIQLIMAGDPELIEITSLSLGVTGVALLFSTVVGVPLGSYMGLKRFFGRSGVIAILYTGMGFPPVVVGLFVYLMLSRVGPFGFMGWLFTPKAMVISQVIISFPLVAGFTMAAVMGVDPNLRKQVKSLGATEWQATLAILKEARIGVMVAIIAGFGSIISEVGSVMLVGGNIKGSTRVLTTAIVLETRKGNFELAMALGIVVLSLAFIANLFMLKLQGRTFDE